MYYVSCIGVCCVSYVCFERVLHPLLLYQGLPGAPGVTGLPGVAGCKGQKGDRGSPGFHRHIATSGSRCCRPIGRNLTCEWSVSAPVVHGVASCDTVDCALGCPYKVLWQQLHQSIRRDCSQSTDDSSMTMVVQLLARLWVVGFVVFEWLVKSLL